MTVTVFEEEGGGILSPLEVEERSSVRYLFKKLKGKANPKYTRDDLFLPRFGIWMLPRESLESYGLQESEVIILRTKSDHLPLKKANVVLPSGLIEEIEFGEKATGQGLLISLRNKPPDFDIYRFTLFIQPETRTAKGSWIEPLSLISQYNLGPQVRRSSMQLPSK